MNDQVLDLQPDDAEPGLPAGTPARSSSPATARAGPGRRKFEDVPRDAWGPRAGFAYRASDRDAFRGGYGIYYAHVSFSQFARQPDAGVRVRTRSRRT